MPESIKVREVKVRVEQQGFRVESFVVVTSLLDAKTDTRDDIAELDHKRRLVELDIRTIQISLGMDTCAACSNTASATAPTEPRAIKRRPKPHKLLTKPRDQARAKLLADTST